MDCGFVNNGDGCSAARAGNSNSRAGAAVDRVTGAADADVVARPDGRDRIIVAELRASVDALVKQLPALGGDPNRIIVSGWSAGGHLTATTLAHPAVKGGVAISGIYDLEPIRHSYLNDKLKLDEEMSRRQSPLMVEGGPDKPLALVVGDAELPILRKQTADMAAHRATYGLPVIANSSFQVTYG